MVRRVLVSLSLALVLFAAPSAASPIQWLYQGGGASLLIHTDTNPSFSCGGGGYAYDFSATYVSGGLTYFSSGFMSHQGFCYFGTGGLAGIGSLSGPILHWTNGGDPTVYDLSPQRLYFEFPDVASFPSLPTEAPLHLFNVELHFVGGPNQFVNFYPGTFTAVPVPEPATWLLLSTGIAAVAAIWRFTQRE